MAMATMNVSLPNDFVAFVESVIASGEYASANEVVRDGLRLLQRAKAEHNEKIRILQREVGIGIEQARARRLSKRSVAEIAAELEADDEASA
jgi:antitoxin ParD1/3/4